MPPVLGKGDLEHAQFWTEMPTPLMATHSQRCFVDKMKTSQFLGSKMNSHSESRPVPDRDSGLSTEGNGRRTVCRRVGRTCARARALPRGRLRGRRPAPRGASRRRSPGSLGPAPRCCLLPAAAAGLGPSISPVEGRLPGGGRMSKAGYAQVAATEDGEEERPRISGGEAGASVFSRMVFQWVDPAVWEGACRIVLPRRSAGRTS